MNTSPGTIGTSTRHGRIACSRHRIRRAIASRGASCCRRAPTISSRWASAFAATTFLSAGNITHTPAYGHLIALGILNAVQEHSASQQQIDNALAYRDHIARTGRFLTFCSGAATIGARMRPDPQDRTALRIVRETDSGLGHRAARSACTPARPMPRMSISAR